MHVLSDTVMPNLFLNITQSCETTLVPISGPSLNLPTVTNSGSTAIMGPTHLLPEHPEPILGDLCNCPWPKQGKKRMRTRTPQDDEAAQAVEGDARTTAITVMHVLSDTVMPNPLLNITRTRETISGPSLNYYYPYSRPSPTH